MAASSAAYLAMWEASPRRMSPRRRAPPPLHHQPRQPELNLGLGPRHIRVIASARVPPDGRLDVPEPWRGNVSASLALIDILEGQIDETNRRLRQSQADHRYIPLLLSVPGVGWVLAFTIAAEIGEIERFSSPEKLTGYTGLCPRVIQSGERDRRGPLSKHGPTYLRWALLEATMHALKHPVYRERYQRTKRRLGEQRGPKVAQVDIARRLAHAIWHMLTRNEKFAPRGAAVRLAP